VLAASICTLTVEAAGSSSLNSTVPVKVSKRPRAFEMARWRTQN